MPRTIHVEYRLTKDLWRRFYEAHYKADSTLRTRYFWGGVCIILGSLGLAGLYASWIVAVLLLATGFFGVLSASLFVARSLKSAEKHPFYGKDIEVVVATTGISVRSGTAGYSQPWSNFSGYRRVKPGFILYHDRRSFFFIPAEAMEEGERDWLEQLLQDVNVPKS